MDLERQRMDMFLNDHLVEPEPETNPEDWTVKLQPETTTVQQWTPGKNT